MSDESSYEVSISAILCRPILTLKMCFQLDNAPRTPAVPFTIWFCENREQLMLLCKSVIQSAQAALDDWSKIADKSEWVRKAQEDRTT